MYFRDNYVYNFKFSEATSFLYIKILSKKFYFLCPKNILFTACHYPYDYALTQCGTMENLGDFRVWVANLISTGKQQNERDHCSFMTEVPIT